jgi:type IV pilus assembly protein PilB
MARKRLGEILVMAGAIDELQLQSALGEQRKWGRPLGATLVEMGLISEHALVKALSDQLNIPVVDLSSLKVPPMVLDFLDHTFCLQYGCIPFGHEEQGAFLDLAMADPTNPELFDLVRVRTRCNLRPHLAGPRSIELAIRHYYLGEALTPTGGADKSHWMTRPDEVVFEEDVIAAEKEASAAQAAATAPDAPDASSPTSSSAAPPEAADSAGGGQLTAASRDALLLQLHNIVQQLRAHLERDEKVLRKLMALIVEKGLCTREELIAKIHEE